MTRVHHGRTPPYQAERRDKSDHLPLVQYVFIAVQNSSSFFIFITSMTHLTYIDIKLCPDSHITCHPLASTDRPTVHSDKRTDQHRVRQQHSRTEGPVKQQSKIIGSRQSKSYHCIPPGTSATLHSISLCFDFHHRTFRTRQAQHQYSLIQPLERYSVTLSSRLGQSITAHLVLPNYRNRHQIGTLDNHQGRAAKDLYSTKCRSSYIHIFQTHFTT